MKEYMARRRAKAKVAMDIEQPRAEAKRVAQMAKRRAKAKRAKDIEQPRAEAKRAARNPYMRKYMAKRRANAKRAKDIEQARAKAQAKASEYQALVRCDIRRHLIWDDADYEVAQVDLIIRQKAARLAVERAVKRARALEVAATLLHG
jgi:hypothetical protein